MGPITAYHDSDSASSTTKSAVEQGELIIRDTENQQQDVNQLSRDTENANDVLGQIFDKQKHLDNIEIIETVNEIRQQAETVMNNQTRLEIQQQALKDDPTLSGKALNDEIDRRFAEQNTTGMGGSMTKALDSVTSIISGALTGNITGGLAGAAAPHIASELKKLEESDPVAHKIAHGILGAVVAELQGGSGLAGGMGAASSEVIVGLIHEQLYPGVPKDELTEKQKETLSMLASLAGGMAGAITGSDNAADIGSAINAGKNAVENNYLKPDEIKETAEQVTASESIEEKKDIWLDVNETDLERQSRTCETPEECRANKDEIKADFKDASERFRELDKRQGQLSPEEALEHQLLGQQLYSMGSALAEANRQLREKIPTSEWTKEEWEDTLSDIALAVGSTYGGIGMPAAGAGKGTTVPQGYNVDPNKFDYFFGKVTTGNPHNVQRSAQNLKDLNTLGIKTEQQLVSVFNKAASEGTVISQKSNNFGTTITKSIVVSDKGAIQVSFFYPNGNLKSTPKVTTLIPKLSGSAK
jgi:hypothetical protein